MAYSEKFQALADAAQTKVQGIAAQDVDALLQTGAIALDIRDKEEHEAGHIPGSVHISRGKLEMNTESALPDLEATILCYCNAFNRGALSAATLQSMGYKNAKFIAGGLSAYRKLTHSSGIHDMADQEHLNRNRRAWVIGPIIGLVTGLLLAGAGYWYLGGADMAGLMGHSPGMHGHGQGEAGHDEVNMPGLKGANATAEESAELAVMFRSFETFTRQVTNLPDGIRTVTRSSDPDVMATLVSHVTGMIGRVETGDDPKIIIQSPTLDIFFARGEGITSDIEVTDEGIVVLQTSTDPEIVTALQTHAAEVSDMAARGMAAVHDMMATH